MTGIEPADNSTYRQLPTE